MSLGGQSHGVLAMDESPWSWKAGFAVETFKRHFAAKLKLESRLSMEKKDKVENRKKNGTRV